MNLRDTTIAIQRKVGAEIDGVWGPQTAGMVAVELGISLEYEPVDPRSAANIAMLLPEVQPYAISLIHAAADAGITIKVISSLRTYEEQNALYAQGRTKPGPIVTNARGGYSWHQFSCSFDFGVFESGRYMEESPLYEAVGKIGEALGLEWGGRFKNFPDEPHMQLTNGKTLEQARALHAEGKTVFS